MAKSSGLELKGILCRALGYDPNNVIALTVRITPEGAAVVTAESVWTTEAVRMSSGRWNRNASTPAPCS